VGKKKKEERGRCFKEAGKGSCYGCIN
jgi:hypothetical protein